ncbi:MAG: energy transducer TonB, partial [Cyclobacteriaceae bacterium]|nr:energy transducer TonB [Cyclobacteriaceae bacterium]
KFPHIGNTEIIIPAEIETASYRETVQEWIVKNTDRSHVIISSPAPQETLNRIFSAGDWEITSHYIDENAGSSRLYAIVCYEPGYRLRDPDREGNSIAGETANMDNNFMKADQQPIPQGGMETFFHYIMNNLKYPEESRVQGIEGKVFVEFVVTKTGDVDQVKVIRGLNIACDEEAKRVVNQSPDWTPGYKDGQPVDVRMVLPITFQLNEKLN